MIIKHGKIVLLMLTYMLFSSFNSMAQETVDVRQLEVSLRMIGHQVMLNSGDSTSRVLPIQKEGDQYKISFGGEFQFTPDKLVTTIDSVGLATGMANYYLVEVEECESKEIVYSFQVENLMNSDIIPCAQRSQPKGCYSLLFTILDPSCLLDEMQSVAAVQAKNVPLVKSSLFSLLMIPVMFLIGWAVFLWKKSKTSTSDTNIIPIGGYQFDKRNMQLSFENSNVELTSKEADLLSLLHSSANVTLDRERILNDVWGDNGDYIGRTLDVFISKLRKKLEADPNVRIANIRGVGYKLVLNETL